MEQPDIRWYIYVKKTAVAFALVSYTRLELALFSSLRTNSISGPVVNINFQYPSPRLDLSYLIRSML